MIPSVLELPCPRIASASSAPLEALADLLAQAPVHRFRQAWAAETEPGFRGGEVRCGWAPDAFVAHAVLHDHDIFNPVDAFNEPSYGVGDVFELFLQAHDDPGYYELHVNPNNAQLQLYFPNASLIQEVRRRLRPKEDLDACRYTDPRFESEVWVDESARRWEVALCVPLRLAAGERVRVAFCRYDYTRSQTRPVLSSTAPLSQLDYHRVAEWTTLRLEE